MRNNILFLIALIALFVCFSTPNVEAIAQEFVQTEMHFNVIADLAIEVTLIGESAVTSGTTAAGTAYIDFNATSSTAYNITCQIVGGSAQTDGNPCMSINNVGTVNVLVTANLNASLPACWNLTWGSTWATRSNNLIGVAPLNATIDANLSPGDAADPLYLVAAALNCGDSDTCIRNFTLTFVHI